jgi:hypothetical protein
MATEKVAKGVLATLAGEMLKGGSEFKAFEEKALALGSTTSSARQTWQRIKKTLGLSNVKSKAEKPQGAGKQRAPKSGVAVAAPKAEPKEGTGRAALSDEELADLIKDGQKYRALKASLA